MAKEKVTRKPKKKAIQDKVIFMAAYDVHKLKHKLPKLSLKKDKNTLLEQFHIKGISSNNTYVSSGVKCDYTVEYDSFNRVSAFHFDEAFIETVKHNPGFEEEIISTLLLRYSAVMLFDSTQIKISTCYNMESFWVKIEGEIYEVDAVAFMMNGALIVNYELIHYDSKVPLTREDIYGRGNNYGIKPIEQIKYCNEEVFSDDNRKISDIIFHNIFDSMFKASKNKWEVDNFSFLHNTLVISNEIGNVSKYMQKVLGAQIENFHRANISATDMFEFYSIEGLGVITGIKGEDILNVGCDVILLEAFKMYLLLKMLIDYEVNHELEKIVNNEIYVESLFYPAHVPIITLNVIDNLKDTVSFNRYKQAIDFKVQALERQQERQKMHNGRLMNILLYVLSIIGSAQTLQVLQTELGIPFKVSFPITLAFFALLGGIWILREFKK